MKPEDFKAPPKFDERAQSVVNDPTPTKFMCLAMVEVIDQDDPKNSAEVLMPAGLLIHLCSHCDKIHLTAEVPGKLEIFYSLDQTTTDLLIEQLQNPRVIPKSLRRKTN